MPTITPTVEVIKHRLALRLLFAIASISTLVVLGLTSFANAQNGLVNTKLSPVLVNGGGIRISAIAPNGSRVVYIADQDTDGVDELYSVPTNGGTTIKLNSILAEGKFVYRFVITPDSNRVIFVVVGGGVRANTLYSVPIVGGEAIVLASANTNEFINYYAFQSPISPDSKWMVYSIEIKLESGIEPTIALYSVPTTGGTPQKLTPPLVNGGSIGRYLITPDSSAVLFLADAEIGGQKWLYHTAIGGGVPLKLNSSPSVTNETVYQFIVSPNSQYVIYATSTNFYSVHSTGGESTRLNITGQHSDLAEFSYVNLAGFSHDSKQVLYYTNTTPTQQSADGKSYTVNLYPIQGNHPITLSSTSVTSGTSTILSNVSFSPNGQHVVFSITDGAQSTQHLYSVFINGGTPTLLAGSIGSDSYFRIDSQSQQVVYHSLTFGSNAGALFSVPITGGNTILLDQLDYMTGGVRLNPDDSGVVYHGLNSGEDFRLFSSSLTTSTPITVSVELSEQYWVNSEYDGPAYFGNQICVAYTTKTLSNSRSIALYSACYPAKTINGTPVPTAIPTIATPTKPAVYLPLVNR